MAVPLRISNVLIMGAPTFKKVDGLSQSGAIVDWTNSHNIQKVYYSSANEKMVDYIEGIKNTQRQIREKKGLGVGGHHWFPDTKYISTTPARSFRGVGAFMPDKAYHLLPINWIESDPYGHHKPLPLFPFVVDIVIVVTTSQYLRQITKNPKKLAWADWYKQRDIPILIMQPNGLFQ